MSTQLLNLDEAAHALRMTPHRLSKLVRRNEVPHVVLPGGELRFTDTDLAAWVESHKASAPARKEATTP